MDNFYVIARNHRAMVEKVKELELDEKAVLDTIDAESWPLEEKGKCVAYAIKEMELSVAAMKQAETEIAKRRKARENRIRQLKEYALFCMSVAQISKIECPEFAMSIRNNPPSVYVFEKGLLPAEYWQQPPAYPNKAKIAEDLKAGKDIPGAVLRKTQRVEIK